MKLHITPKAVFYVLVAIGIGVGAWYWHFVRTPEYLIKKQIHAIAEDVNKAPGETNTVMGFKMVAFLNRLANHVDVSVHGIPIEGGFSGDELGSHVSRGRMFADMIYLKPVEIYVTLLDDTHATAECELIARATSKEGSYHLDEVYHLRLSLELDSAKHWVFTGFHESKFMER
ncbi:MAG: hypothetical protein II943_01545 [Victivallales bacterium]|nr:hypothetical protein [Victivallales bacterium]